MLEQVNELREQGMSAYEAAADTARWLARGCEGVAGAHLLFAHFYHTNALLHSIMSDQQRAPKHFRYDFVLFVFHDMRVG